MSSLSLASDFEAYSQWRSDLTGLIGEYKQWLNRESLNDAQREIRLQHLIDRLSEDKLHVAFVAEFSRGKSELINAIFLSDLKQRLLPSTAGRTTMCPTELLYDTSKPPHILLLPIESRLTARSVTEFKKHSDDWTIVAMDVKNTDSVVKAMHEVCRVKTVSVAEATRMGLYNASTPEASMELNPDGSVTIPAWRHAIINYPHPYLEKGLVVYDTPGLNAIGVEPELTFNLLPNAHAVLFVLSADTGVTKSDIDVWRNHINLRGTQRGRLVALNKIDGLWDELKTEEQINAEIDKQANTCAHLLGIQPSQVYPVTAQKGLQAKIQANDALMTRSRLGALEKALSEELISSKQAIVREQTDADLTEMLNSSRILLGNRRQNLEDQLAELHGLQGKNEDVVQHIMEKITHDKETFEKSLQQFQALRSVFSQQSIKLFSQIGMDTLKTAVTTAREAMVQSKFTKGIRDAMNGFFSSIDQNLDAAANQVDEINRMMEAMYKKLNDEHGLAKFSPPPFSILRYRREILRLEEAYEKQINTLFTFLTTEQNALTSRFFETVASRVIQVYELLNKESETWLRAVMSPMESQVREHQMQLRRRLESVKRIHKAADSLEDRITELAQMRTDIDRQNEELVKLSARIHATLAFEAAQIAKTA